MRRTSCGNCGKDTLEQFLDMGASPLPNEFPETKTTTERFWPLQLAVCTSCWLVQSLTIIPDEDIFGQDYGFYSSAALPRREYHWRLAEDLLKRYHEQARSLTVEIACNDGDLLQYFQKGGCRTLGIDPSFGPVEIARERGLDVLRQPFTATTGKSIQEDYGKAGLIIANHVAAHIVDLHDFFEGIALLLARDGIAIIEVNYLASFLTGNQFDGVYHEHRYHHSVTSLRAVAAAHGLYVRDVELVEPQGGSVRVHLGHAGGYVPRVDTVLADEGWLRDMSAFRGCQGRIQHLRQKLLQIIDDHHRQGQRLAGYGATAKSTTLLNFCGVGPDVIEYVVDTTPYKQGRFTPGTHIPIVADHARDAPNAYLLFAWNYLGSIVRKERVFIASGGKFIVPIPSPVII